MRKIYLDNIRWATVVLVLLRRLDKKDWLWNVCKKANGAVILQLF